MQEQKANLILDPEKVVSVKVSAVKEYEGQIDCKRFEKQWEGKTLVSYSARVQLEGYGDTWFSGFFNESKKTPGTPAVWVGMDIDATLSSSEKTKDDGTAVTYYNVNKLSKNKKAELEKAELLKKIAMLEAGTSTPATTSEDVGLPFPEDEEVEPQINEEDIPF